MNPWGTMSMRPVPPYPVYHQQPPTNLPYPPYPMDQSAFVSGLYDHPVYQMPNHSYGGYYQNQPIPYPSPSLNPNETSNMFMQSFKNEDGSLNLNKMIDTAGMMMNTVSQFSSMIKGVSGFFKA